MGPQEGKELERAVGNLPLQDGEAGRGQLGAVLVIEDLEGPLQGNNSAGAGEARHSNTHKNSLPAHLGLPVPHTDAQHTRDLW